MRDGGGRSGSLTVNEFVTFHSTPGKFCANNRVVSLSMVCLSELPWNVPGLLGSR